MTLTMMEKTETSTASMEVLVEELRDRALVSTVTKATVVIGEHTIHTDTHLRNPPFLTLRSL